MAKKHCPFCMKANLKGYPFTPDTPAYRQEPYDTSLDKACLKCCHCPTMEKALSRNAYHNMKEFCLTYVNGRGELKSVRVIFADNTATVYTTPNYRKTEIPAPVTIGENETRTLQARLYNVHAELWSDSYSSGNSAYTWWELAMKFSDAPDVKKRGTDKLPPQWNRLIKLVGVYYPWLYYDWSSAKMYKLKFNHRTRTREIPVEVPTPFIDYWAQVKTVPAPVTLPTAEEIAKGANVCVYARSNTLGVYSSTEKQMKHCRAFCRELKLNIVSEYIDEGETGLDEAGEQLKRLFREIPEKRFDYVILASISRFSRDVEKAAAIQNELEKHNVKAVILPPKKWGYWLNY